MQLATGYANVPMLSPIEREFGAESPISRRLIHALYTHIDESHPAYEQWVATFERSASKQLETNDLTAMYNIRQIRLDHLVFAIQTFYAILNKLVAAHALNIKCDVSKLADIRRIETGAAYRDAGISNYTEGDWYSWYVDVWDDLMSEAVDRLDRALWRYRVQDEAIDALKMLYHNLFPRRLRYTLGEYYTPDWLAHYLLNRVAFDGKQTLLDPACGSGTFLALAIQRAEGHYSAYEMIKNRRVAGIDINPMAALAARTNLVRMMGKHKDELTEELTLPIYEADAIINPPELGQFDVVVGNPPWINWESMPDSYRAATRPLWIEYGLFMHSGVEAWLGKSRKDLATLMTYVCADHYVRDQGLLGFVITQSALKSSGANDGFRQFELPDQTPLGVIHVDDLTSVRVFPSAMPRAAIIIIKKGQETSYPVPYDLWKKTSPQRGLREDDTYEDVMSRTQRTHLNAEPIRADDLTSPWISGKPAALQAVRKLIGESDYTAHSGAYTGGANGAYWVEILGQKDGLLHIRNLIARSKRPVPQVETYIEPDFIFPLLRGRDVYRWRAIPGAHILIVQDPETRSGYDEEWLEQNYPHTYAYIKEFEYDLLQRAAFKRYFREGAAFYSMFDIGMYTFKPYKVVWKGFGIREMRAAVISSVDGKPIMTNQAMHPFIGLDDADEAHYLCACLNSSPFEFTVLSHAQPGGKSFAQPGMLTRLRLPKFEPYNPAHQAMIAISRHAHDNEGETPHDYHETAAQVWHLTDDELADVVQSLEELTHDPSSKKSSKKTKKKSRKPKS